MFKSANLWLEYKLSTSHVSWVHNTGDLYMYMHCAAIQPDPSVIGCLPKKPRWKYDKLMVEKKNQQGILLIALVISRIE